MVSGFDFKSIFQGYISGFDFVAAFDTLFFVNFQKHLIFVKNGRDGHLVLKLIFT